MTLHMIKLVVGLDTIDELIHWHSDKSRPWIMNTRQTPKRAADLLAGGSLYRVFRGVILCRQRILAVDTVGEGVTARCEVTVDPQVVRVAPTPRRAFQGWRYLEAKDAPPDMAGGEDGDIPVELARQLREAGAW